MYPVNVGYQPQLQSQFQAASAPFRAGVDAASQPRARARHAAASGWDRLPPVWSSTPATIRRCDAAPAKRAVPPRPPSAPCASAPGSPLTLPFDGIDDLFGALSPSMLKIADDVARQGDPWALPPCDLPLATPAPGPQRARHQPVSTPQPAGKAKVPSRTRRSDITREIVLDISERLQAGGCSINGCAERHGVALRVVRALVQPGGRLTPVGRALVAGNIMTPLDRANAGLPPVDRQTGLNVEDHALAGKLIGVTRGKMSRAMFCDLFGYDYDLIYAAYNQNGSITGWGRRSRDAAPGSQAPQAPKWSTSGKVPGTGEQRRSMGAGNLAPRGAAGPVPTPRG